MQEYPISPAVEMYQYASLAEIINPEKKPLRVLYPGVNHDIQTPLLITNPIRVVAVDINPLQESYFPGGTPVITDLKRDLNQLRPTELSMRFGQPLQIDFMYTHPWECKPRYRNVRYYTADYFTFWPPEYEDGYDVLIARGEAPNFATHDIQIKQLGEKLVVGGFFISDRSITNGVYADVVRSYDLGFKEIKTDIQFPNDRVHIYKKVRQVNLDLLSRYFQYVDLFWEILDMNRYRFYYEHFKRNKQKLIDDSLSEEQVEAIIQHAYEFSGTEARSIDIAVAYLANLYHGFPQEAQQGALKSLKTYYQEWEAFQRHFGL